MIQSLDYHGAKVDVWSCGVILYAMICGYLPFEDPETALLYQKILKGEFALPDFVSKSGGDLLAKVLNTDPEQRYTEARIRKHKWFNMY
jgi:5'-AMP-activated protein kinase catalytic alpha subunit